MQAVRNQCDARCHFVVEIKSPRLSHKAAAQNVPKEMVMPSLKYGGNVVFVN